MPPTEWQTRFWATPEAQALTKLEPQALADLVPKQAGLRYCRCPGCGASETSEPLLWSIRKPEVVACRACQASFPSDSVPARDKDKKIPEEAVEVAPRSHPPLPLPTRPKPTSKPSPTSACSSTPGATTRPANS